MVQPVVSVPDDKPFFNNFDQVSLPTQATVPVTAPVVEQPVDTVKTFTEHTYKKAYKLKSMKLLRLRPGQGWEHIVDVKDLYMAKIAYNPAGDRVYVLGGAKDQRSKETVTTTTVYHFTEKGISRQEVAPMIDPRASFGSLYRVAANDSVIVAGGYINGKLTTRCESYSPATNKWTALPELNEAKASSSLCLIGGNHLLCMGGLARNTQGQAYLTNSIEVLRLDAEAQLWSKLQMPLPITGCDIGCLPIAQDEVLLFGGWNKTAQTGVHVMQRTSEATNEMVVKELSPLSVADFFLVNSIAMPVEQEGEADKIRICGHSQVFTFNRASKQFEAHSQF
jgi:hypothetical protein